MVEATVIAGKVLTGYAWIDLWLVPLLNSVILAILAAIVIGISFAIGFYVAKFINRHIKLAMKQFRVEEWIDRHGIGHALHGIRITTIITIWVWAYVITAALGSGFSIAFGSDFFLIKEQTGIITGFIDYLESIAPAIVVAVGALFIAKYVSNHVRKGGLIFSHHMAEAIDVVVAFFAIYATLPTFLPNVGAKIDELLVEVFRAGVYAIAAVIALAFGLGLKDEVANAAKKNDTVIERYIEHLGKK